MKKFITFCMMLLYSVAYTQSLPILETSTLDDKLANVDKSSVTSGILYQRSAMYTALFDYNKSADFNTADADFFEQSLTDLYYGSKQTMFTDFMGLRNKISVNKYLSDVVDIGILNTPFHILNYNEENPWAGGLLFDPNTQLFSQISGQPPFFGLHTTVIAPLKKEAKGNAVTFTFKNDLFFTNGDKTIKSLTANLGDGINRNIIVNGIFTPQDITVNYSTTGNKLLVFNITYSDNTTLVTNGTFYFQYVDYSAARIASSMCNGETLADDFSITSDTAFKGYDEAYAFKGKLDYRVFYRTGGFDRRIRKPIIIDGFDPGDKRKIFACEMTNYVPKETFSIQDMMTYVKSIDGVKREQDLIQELRDKGYDVTIVNHPTYCIRNTEPYDVIDCKTPGAKEIDGGADYIERNALTLATLIKSFNTQLKTNGSTEQLAIVGPSMGGQTSRYALAYLEKQGTPHNTRLWISIDSPHLGANIPLGDQALLFLASRAAKSAMATDFYDKRLNSAAAKQQIIDLHKPLEVTNPIFNTKALSTEKLDESYLNGRVVSQGYSGNSGNPFYQQYYNNQYNNGLPNSKGYPMNLRKIAMINGSLTGSKKVLLPDGTALPNGVAEEQVINMRGFTKITVPIIFNMTWTFTIHIASLESYFMPNYNTGTNKIARLKKGTDYYGTFSRNINSRGSLDELPGGWFLAQNEIVAPLLGKSPVEGVRGSFWQYTEDNLKYWFVNKLGTGYWDLRKLVPTASFIPSFSSLAIKTPERNWGENLQRNLVCTGETPFDSYYGASENTQHTSFTEESVKWMMKELGDFQTPPSPQAPWFPIDTTNFTSTDIMCLNTNNAYGFSDVCKLPSDVIWSLSPNLQKISSTGTNITVRGVANGQGTITATFSNGQTFTKNIWIGAPVFAVTQINNPNYYNESHFYLDGIASATDQGVTQIKWTKISSTSPTARLYASLNETEGFASGADNSWSMDVMVEITNPCGTSTQMVTIMPPASAGCDGYSVAKSGSLRNAYRIIDPCNSSASKTIQSSESSKLTNITTEITDVNGKRILQTNVLEFNLDNQLQGVYYLRIIKNGKVVHTQTLIKN